MRKTIHCGRVTTLVLLSLLVLTAVHGQDMPAKNAEGGEVQALKQELAEQKNRLEELRLVVLDQKKQIDSVKQQQSASASAAPVPATTVAQSSTKETGLLASASPRVSPDPAPKPFPLVPPPAPQGAAAEPPSPLQIKIGEATITPVGFMDITNTWRSTNAGTSLPTNFGSFPYNNTVQGRLTEDKWSAENSRLGFRVDAQVKGANVLGYFEGDFVGLGNAANNTQVSSNSMLFRMRQYYVDVRKGFWEVLAGQAWSMILPNRKGMSPLPADLFYTQVVDVNYTNGLYWGRIPGIRFIGHPSNKVTFGVALENSTQYFGGSGGGGIPTLPAAFAANAQNNTQLDNSVNNDRTVANIRTSSPSSRSSLRPGSISKSVGWRVRSNCSTKSRTRTSPKRAEEPPWRSMRSWSRISAS